MTLFLSTYINKVDKKGRVSVPASFRAALANQAFQGVVVIRSNAFSALEGFSWDYMQELGNRLDAFDLFSAKQDDLATAIFAEARQLAFDGDGRVMLPQDLAAFAGLDEQAAFVGMGRKFQIWNPQALEKRQEDARNNIRKLGLTLPKQGASNEP